jgi:cobalamin biosynthesis protein CobT
MTMQKRKTDAAFLAAQSDVVVDHVEVEMDHNTVPLLAQMAAAMQCLIAKDRSFVDPLKPDGNGGDNGGEEGIEMTLEEEESEEAAMKTKLSQAQGVDAAEDNGATAEDDADADADDASESSSDDEDEEEYRQQLRMPPQHLPLQPPTEGGSFILPTYFNRASSFTIEFPFHFRFIIAV